MMRQPAPPQGFSMTDATSAGSTKISQWRRLALVVGPGLVVMLADTDAGSIITAAQSGAQWGYKLLLAQLVLVPVLYIVQELTVRLGVVTGKGHGKLIAEQFGPFWAWLSVATLVVACLGALLTELSGLAGVGDLFGVPDWLTVTMTVALLVAMAVTGSYQSVERIAMAIGAFELLFLAVAAASSPNASQIARQTLDIPISDSKYLYLVAANIGAVIMPWMVFYQQSAVVEKRLQIDDLPAARADTFLGAIITQIVMAAMLVAAAAALGADAPADGTGPALQSVQDIAGAFTPVIGVFWGKAVFALGMSGAALVATIVVTLTAARTLGEVLDVPHTLDKSLTEAPWFYSFYALALVVGGAIVLSGVDLIQLSVAVQVMNSLLLPFVLGFLLLLARRLPRPHRLEGFYAGIVACTLAVTTIFAVYASIAGLWQ